MWGANVPLTRTPDAHWVSEVRYRGTKVVTVSPDYADNTKFADSGCPPRRVPTRHWQWRWATSSLRRTTSTSVSVFEDFSLTYTDLPFLVTLETRERRGFLKFLTAAKLAGEARAG